MPRAGTSGGPPVEKRAVFVRPGPPRSDPGPVTRGGGRAGEGARPDQSARGPRRHRRRQTNTTWCWPPQEPPNRSL